MRIVLLYKRGPKSDEYVLAVLEHGLRAAGHDVFINRHLRIGVEWATEMEREIGSADAVIFLLSPASILSAMFEGEVELAVKAAQQFGGPRLLPVRIDFEDVLPEPFFTFVGRLQSARWRSPADDDALLGDLFGLGEAGEGPQTTQASSPTKQRMVFISYSRQPKENAEFVRELADKLRAANFEVWLDEERISIADNIQEKIVEAISDADAALFVVDSRWLQKDRDFIQFEVSLVGDQRAARRVVVLREPAGMKDLGPYFCTLNRTEWYPDDSQPDARFWEIYCGITGTPPGPRNEWEARGRSLSTPQPVPNPIRPTAPVTPPSSHAAPQSAPPPPTAGWGIRKSALSPSSAIHDDFRCSAFYPERAAVGSIGKIIASIHTQAEAAEVVREVALRLDLPHSVPLRAATNDKGIQIRGQTIIVTPDVPGLSFDLASVPLPVWQDQQLAEFRFRTDPDSSGRLCRGWLHFWIGGLILADVAISILITDGSEVPEMFREAMAEANARPYRFVFPSYSHADEEVVERLEAYAESFGDRYLRDVKQLRTGQKWQDELGRFILKASVFQLFWSEKAAKSPYVTDEWRYALQVGQMVRNDPYFLRPVYWSDSLVPEPPKELNHLHFAKVPLLKN